MSLAARVFTRSELITRRTGCQPFPASQLLLYLMKGVVADFIARAIWPARAACRAPLCNWLWAERGL